MRFDPDSLKRAGLIITSAALLGLAACSSGNTAPTQAEPTISSPLPAPHTEIETHGWPEQVLAGSQNSELQQLAKYGDVLQQRLPDSLMTFTGMPGNPEQAEADAATMAETLKDYHAAGVTPLVVMEPQSYDDGNILDLNDIAAGGSDALMTTYYQKLKQQGVTDAMMGEWVVLPEANTPAWNNADPRVVRSGIIHLAQVQKSVFPESRVSIMLDGETYDGNDTNYENGRYVSLLPYVQGIPRGLIDSFGLQGFPWIDAGASPSTVDSPSDYLSAQRAIEAAKALGVPEVWLNTGTPAIMHANDPTGRVVLSAPERGQLLQAVSEQAMAIKAAGLKVTVNMFAADKSNVEGEWNDWSYLKSAADQKVLADFVRTELANGIRNSFFDSTNP